MQFWQVLDVKKIYFFSEILLNVLDFYCQFLFIPVLDLSTERCGIYLLSYSWRICILIKMKKFKFQSLGPILLIN